MFSKQIFALPRSVFAPVFHPHLYLYFSPYRRTQFHLHRSSNRTWIPWESPCTDLNVIFEPELLHYKWKVCLLFEAYGNVFHFLRESDEIRIRWNSGLFLPALVLTKLLHWSRLHQHSINWDWLLLVGGNLQLLGQKLFVQIYKPLLQIQTLTGRNQMNQYAFNYYQGCTCGQ